MEKFEKGTNRPKKVRYMNFENVGELKIDANKGDLLHKPRYWDVRREIEQQLNLVGRLCVGDKVCHSKHL